MNNLLTVSLIILNSIACLAQNSDKYQLTIDWPRLKPFIIEDQNFHIVNVVDGRSDKNTSFGKVRKGAFNKMTEVEFAEGLVGTIQKYIGFQVLTKPKDSLSFPATIRIKEINFSERVDSGAEHATVRVFFEYLDEGGTIVFAAVTSNTFSGMEVTPKQASLLTQSINDNLQIFNFADKLKPMSTKYDNNEIEILSERPERGIYASFLDFRNNSPSYTYDFVLSQEKTNRSIEVKLDSEVRFFEVVDPAFGFDQEMFLSKIYGFSDGKEAYMRVFENSFIEISSDIKGRYFVFQGKVSGFNTGAVTTGAVLGGIIGATIAAAATSGSKTTDLVLDLKTGDLWVLSRRVLDDIIEKYPEIYAVFKKQSNDKYNKASYWINQVNLYIKK